MQGDEHPQLVLARAEGRLNVLSALGIHKSDRVVVRILTRCLPREFYDVQQHTSLLRPGITRSEMEKIVRTSHANRKSEHVGESEVGGGGVKGCSTVAGSSRLRRWWGFPAKAAAVWRRRAATAAAAAVWSRRAAAAAAATLWRGLAAAAAASDSMEAPGRSSISSGSFFFFLRTSTFRLLDKPWSQVSSLSPPRIWYLFIK